MLGEVGENHFYDISRSAGKFRITEFGISPEIFTEIRYHLACFLKHVQVNVQHTDGRGITVAEVHIQLMVSVGYHILDFIAMATQCRDDVGLFPVNHRQSVIEQGGHSCPYHFKISDMTRRQRQEVVINVFLAYLADSAQIVED